MDAEGWLTISALAELKGVSKQSMHERVQRLARDGRITTERRAGRVYVPLAAYDAAVGETTDLARARAAAAPKQTATAPAASGTYTREQARHAAIKADLAQIELDRQRGTLVAAAEVEELAARAGAALVKAGEQLAARSDEGAAAVLTGGTAAHAVWLRKEIRALLETFARELALVERDGLAREMPPAPATAEPAPAFA